MEKTTEMTATASIKPPVSKRKFWQRPMDEFAFFLTMPRDMRVLLATNLIYAFVLPVIEIFVGAYVMR
ncbi:MAG: hypothetical protein O9262_03835, partial [Cyclobacteriaceae bacterium]|nr:hypothetical protein [Cyclobacteriaceae bacterium]